MTPPSDTTQDDPTDQHVTGDTGQEPDTLTDAGASPAEPAADEDGEDGSSGERRGRLARLPGWLPWAIALVAIGVAAFTTTQWLSLRGQDQAQAHVEQVTSDFVHALTNWDATQGIDTARKSIESFGTGQFLDEANQIFGGDLGAQLEALKATSEGEVQDVFVQRLQGDQAVTFAVVKQVIHTQLDEGGQTTFHSARVELTRVDGVWKVANVELLSPTLDANAALSPSGTSSPAPGDTPSPAPSPASGG